VQVEMLTDDEQLARICYDYWLQDDQGQFVHKIKDIAACYGMMPQAVSKFVDKYCFVWLSDIRCTRCAQPYHFSTRRLYQERCRFRNRVCAVCLEAERRSIAEKKQAAVLKIRNTSRNEDIKLESLDLKSKIYLLSAIQAQADEKFNTIEPLNGLPPCTLSPDHAYDEDIVEHLIDNNIFILSVGTRPDAITLLDNDKISIELGKCEFELACKQEQTIEFINHFFDESTLDNVTKSEEFIEVCKEVQLNECISFLKLALKEHQLHLSPGEKTRLVLSQCLVNFSVAQVYNFIWRGAKDAAAFYMRSSIVKKHAANSAISNISRNMERALAYGWDVKPFHRNHNLPQSSISRIIFNMMLGTDDGGFEYPLHDLIKIEQDDLTPK
jgi:hypothetical protein